MKGSKQPDAKAADKVKRMSAFAESAYAHATHESSTPPHNSFMSNLTNKIRGKVRAQEREDFVMQDANQEYNLLYYPDASLNGTTVQGLNNHRISNNIVHAEFQPLAGTSIVLITETSCQDNLGSPRVLKIMEERENIGCTIEEMGARWVPTLDSNVETITHAIWIGADNVPGSKGGTIWKRIASDALNKLTICQSMDIPVVNISWLVDIHKLNPGQHWSEVDIEAHKPFVMNVLEKYNKHALERNQPGSKSQHKSTDSRRDSKSRLSASIGSTYNSLLSENPDSLEADAIKRAMELSMLDFAIVHHIPTERKYTNANDGNQRTKRNEENPYEVLRINADASREEIKRAFRQRALETHPDKGGKPGEFEAVARAYRLILNATNKTGLEINPSEDGSDKDGLVVGLKSTAHWDSELKEHRNLVRELYTNHGHDMNEHIQRQALVIEKLGLVAKDAGSQTINEKAERINNSCFYLSLSCSYLSGIGALEVWDTQQVGNDYEDESLLMAPSLLEADATLILDTALSLKRTIEAAVLSAHPEWVAQGMVGEEVQAFSDFLVYTLESQTIVNDWAVVVFDAVSGFCDVYKGKGYAEHEGTEAYDSSNTITIKYLSGHYQPLISLSSRVNRPSLKQILSALDEAGVLYVVTDGAATPKQH